MTSEEKQIKIGRYLNGEMTENEIKSFELLLAENDGLKKKWLSNQKSIKP